jgi:hypothetical protein
MKSVAGEGGGNAFSNRHAVGFEEIGIVVVVDICRRWTT